MTVQALSLGLNPAWARKDDRASAISGGSVRVVGVGQVARQGKTGEPHGTACSGIHRRCSGSDRLACWVQLNAGADVAELRSHPHGNSVVTPDSGGDCQPDGDRHRDNSRRDELP